MQSEWLSRALEESRARGFLGPADLSPQVAHALGFANVWDKRHASAPQRFLDLGSGGGLPGLVLLEKWESAGVLLDSMERRTRFLTEALSWNGAPTLGEVVTERAEVAARRRGLEESFDLVVIRAFGPPSSAAECGARFLRLGGQLIVSEPPGPPQGGQRWSSAALTLLGLELGDYDRSEFGFQIIIKTSDTPVEYPRSSTSVKKRPLF